MLHKAFTTLANGAPGDCNTTTQLQIGDVVNLVRLDAGTLLTDAQLVVSTAFGTGVKADIGFAYADGVDSTAVPQDDDFFGTGITVATAGRYRNATSNPSVTLPKEAWLTMTTAGAANAKASELEIIVFAINEGVA